MRSTLAGLVAALLATGSPGCAASPTPAPPASRPGAPTEARPAPRPARPLLPGSAVPGEYLVTLEPGAGEAAVRQACGGFGIGKLREISPGVFLVGLGSDPGLARMKEIQSRDPRLRAVQPNLVYQANP